uniref:Uncharacterized protein n=1 Tax=Salix viminalis TaxID=40686 RepID=A0A6N2LAZ0_SALVM
MRLAFDVEPITTRLGWCLPVGRCSYVCLGEGASTPGTTGFSGDETAPFFGFLGAAAALVFSCMGQRRAV